MTQGRRRALWCWLLPLATLLVFVVSLAVGSGGFDWQLIVALRWPRVLAAAGVGALLALSGLSMQVLLRNPLADPYVLGTSGGAAVGSLLAMLAGAALWVGASTGALASALLLLALARRSLMAGDDASPRLILIGAMLASVFGALSTLLLTITPDERLRGALFWLIGDLSGADGGMACIGLAVLFTVFMVWRHRRIDRLMLGSEAAHLLGEPVRRLRTEQWLIASLSAGVAVSTAGAIGFVGLVVPQLLRLAGIDESRHLAWMCPTGGAALVMLADLLARTALSPMELPVGAVMALIGAPLFILFLTRGR